MAVYRLPVLISWTGATGSPGVNTWFFRNNTSAPETDGVNQAIDALQALYTDLQGKFPSSVTFQMESEATSVSLGDDNPVLLSGLHTWSHSGTGGESYLPPSQCIVANLKTQSATRIGRGRKFFGPLRANILQANGTPVESDRQDFATAIQTNIIDQFEDPDAGAFAVYSPTNKQAFDITGVGVPNIFGVLRSRRD